MTKNKLVVEPIVSLVLPAFNEGDHIEVVLDKLDRIVNGSVSRYEVVVVDDGSFDDTFLRALRYAAKNSHVRVVRYDANIGKGFAIKTGFWKCRGEYVVFVDSDLEVDVGLITRFIRALEYGDVVIGSKWHSESVVDAPLIRKLLSRCFNCLVKLLTGLEVSDTQTGIKAVRRSAFREVFKRLSVKRYAFDVELLVLAKVYGLRVIELPVKVRIGKMFRFREIWRMLLDLLGIAYRLRIKKWYQRGL